jgi:hypothetical protein
MSATNPAISAKSAERFRLGQLLGRLRLCHRPRFGGDADLQRIDPDRPFDVLERLLAEIDKIRINPAARVFVSGARNQHAARLAERLDPSGDVDPVAENVVALDQHVAEVDADAIDDAFRLGCIGVALGHQFLDRNGAFDGGDDGGKFQQQPVAHRFDDPAPERRQDRPARLTMLANAARRPRFVLTHQTRVADDVDRHDRGEAAGRGHYSGTPAMRMPSRMVSNWAR